MKGLLALALALLTCCSIVTAQSEAELCRRLYVSAGSEQLPATVELHENYPNPFNPGTVIPFDLSTSALVSLEVFDALGRRLCTLVDDVLPAGRHHVRWDASGFPSGISWSRIEVQGRVHTAKLLFVR